MILINSLIDVPRQLVGTCRRVLKYRKHDCGLTIQSRICIHRIIYDRDVRDIGQMYRPDLINIDEQGIGNFLAVVILIADAEHPGLIVLIVNVSCRHRKVLRVYQL